MSKRNATAVWTTDTDTSEVTVAIPTLGATYRQTINELPPEMIIRLAMHGFEQKVRDSYAGAKEAVESGEAKSAEDYVQYQIESTIEMIRSGDWARRATGDGGDLAKAIAEAFGKSRAEVAARLATMDEDAKKALRKVPKIKALLQEYRAAREAEKAKAAAAKVGDEEDTVPGFEDWTG
jgi:hypothetical protein